MAITKVKLFMEDGTRLEVQQLDTNGVPVAIAVTDPNATIDVMTTDTVPARIASFPRDSVRYWSSDIATVTNA